MTVRRVLLIDDDDDIREIAEITLTAVAGWEVLTAASGEEGIELAAAEQPDAILLDVMMPGLDGPGTLTRLRAGPDTCGIPVVLLTAKAQTSDRHRLNGLGAQGLLTKPFDPLQLPAQLAAAVGWEE